jgi:hypothetical protein
MVLEQVLLGGFQSLLSEFLVVAGCLVKVALIENIHNYSFVCCKVLGLSQTFFEGFGDVGVVED